MLTYTESGSLWRDFNQSVMLETTQLLLLDNLYELPKKKSWYPRRSSEQSL